MTDLSFRRVGVARKRRIRPVLTENAAQAIGVSEPGMELYGFSKGQFSLIDIVVCLLTQTGPADVTIATWTAASVEIENTQRLLRTGAIKSLRFLVDFSFPRRQPKYCVELRDAFGDDCIRVTKTHAKFVLIRNESWNLVVRTSMNLNANARFENFEISDDSAMADFLDGVVAEVFSASDGASVMGERPSWHVEKFNAFGVVPASFHDDSAFGMNLDDPLKPGSSFGD